MGADPNCVKINAGTKVNQEIVIVNPNGTLANVLVAIVGEVPGASVPKTPLVIEQRGCIYHPRMSAAMVGQKLHIINNDNTLHNITGVSQKGNRFSLAQPVAGMTFDFTLKDPEILMLVRCQIHKWMLGYIGVVSNPFFDVTQADGAFTLKNVPAGKYTVETWHERYGRQQQRGRGVRRGHGRPGSHLYGQRARAGLPGPGRLLSFVAVTPPRPARR